MTGKQLKEFAARCTDEAEVEVRERPYGAFEKNFHIRAIIEVVIQKENEEVEA